MPDITIHISEEDWPVWEAMSRAMGCSVQRFAADIVPKLITRLGVIIATAPEIGEAVIGTIPEDVRRGLQDFADRLRSTTNE
jgi:hypothetical protein